MKHELRSLLILMAFPILLAIIWNIQASEETLPNSLSVPMQGLTHPDSLHRGGLHVPKTDTLTGTRDLFLRPTDKKDNTVRDLLLRPEDQPNYAYIDTLKLKLEKPK